MSKIEQDGSESRLKNVVVKEENIEQLLAFCDELDTRVKTALTERKRVLEQLSKAERDKVALQKRMENLGNCQEAVKVLKSENIDLALETPIRQTRGHQQQFQNAKDAAEGMFAKKMLEENEILLGTADGNLGSTTQLIRKWIAELHRYTNDFSLMNPSVLDPVEAMKTNCVAFNVQDNADSFVEFSTRHSGKIVRIRIFEDENTVKVQLLPSMGNEIGESFHDAVLRGGSVVDIIKTQLWPVLRTTT